MFVFERTGVFGVQDSQVWMSIPFLEKPLSDN